MKHIYHKKYEENIYYKKINNGLKVYLIPKPEFYKTFVTFTTKYGSLDQSFIPLNKTRRVNQPAGIAHFLEHKMFAMPDKSDAFEKLSSFGVSANAFTSYDKTSYLFSGTENIKEALIYLLDFVQTPYFTKANVLKEQGIIEEELLMYLDYPSNRLYTEIAKNLYKNHPFNTEIIGTKESIYKITPHQLYLAYNTFYHPSNMILTIVGNFNKDEFIKIIEDNQNNKNFQKASPIVRTLYNEPYKIVRKESVIKMSVNTNYLALGVKLRPKKTTYEQYKSYYSLIMLLQMYFSSSSKNYQELLKKGLINKTFSTGGHEMENILLLTISSMTPNSELLKEELIKMLINLKRKTINEKELNTIKKAYQGEFYSDLNSVENININFMSNIMYGIDLFDIPDLIDSITAKDLKDIAHQIKKEYITAVTVVPLENS